MASSDIFLLGFSTTAFPLSPLVYLKFINPIPQLEGNTNKSLSEYPNDYFFGSKQFIDGRFSFVVTKIQGIDESV
jgi:hypothetical protein